MKVKKIVKRLRKLSAEFHTHALNYDGEARDAERARLQTIADLCQVLADEVFTKPAVPSKKKGLTRKHVERLAHRHHTLMQQLDATKAVD